MYMSIFSWINVESLQRVSISLFRKHVKYTAHGHSFMRLQYICTCVSFHAPFFFFCLVTPPVTAVPAAIAQTTPPTQPPIMAPTLVGRDSGWKKQKVTTTQTSTHHYSCCTLHTKHRTHGIGSSSARSMQIFMSLAQAHRRLHANIYCK